MSFTVGKTLLTYDKSYNGIIKVKSRNKNYHVNFSKSIIKPQTNDVVIIDRKVDELYNISSISERVFLIDAIEENKNMENVMNVIDFLSKSKMKKDGTMHVIGGDPLLLLGIPHAHPNPPTQDGRKDPKQPCLGTQAWPFFCECRSSSSLFSTIDMTRACESRLCALFPDVSRNSPCPFR